MRVAVSSCLLGVCCKYSGGHNRSDELLELLEGHEVIPVCPEVLGGLPVPRPSCEIVNGTVRTQTGEGPGVRWRSWRNGGQSWSSCSHAAPAAGSRTFTTGPFPGC